MFQGGGAEREAARWGTIEKQLPRPPQLSGQKVMYCLTISQPCLS